MSDISVDQKLQLIRQIRTQHSQDRMDLMNRERILFGKTGQYRDLDYNVPVHNSNGYGSGMVGYNKDYEYGLDYESTTKDPEELQIKSLKRALFKIRLVTALILAILLILLDQQNSPFLGVSTSEIFTMIEEDYYTQMEEYINGLLF